MPAVGHRSRAQFEALVLQPRLSAKGLHHGFTIWGVDVREGLKQYGYLPHYESDRAKMKYWAFLSYSHTDAKWGHWLHKALETYRVPRRLVGQESCDGKIPQRLFPIFRDREELPVSADLGAKINHALRESRYLIVICSPRSAQSRWVGEEIKIFQALGREDRILAFIVDGEPHASEGKPGFTLADECFHEAMRSRFSPDGALVLQRVEPIAADAREGKDGRANAKLKLIAGLLGISYGDLKQREQERRLRRARAVVAMTLVILAIFAGLAIALFFKEREASRAREEAIHARDRAHLSEEEALFEKRAAEQARDEARVNLSRSGFLQALRSIEEGEKHEALGRLAQSISLDRRNEAAVWRLYTLLLYDSFSLPVSRARLDDELAWIELPWSGQFTPDGKRIVTASMHHTARIWDTQTGKPMTQPLVHGGRVNFAQFSDDGRLIVTASEDTTARIWDAQSGRPLTEPMSCDGQVYSARFSPDGKWMTTAAKGVRIWEVASGRQRMSLSAGGETLWADFSPDGKRIVAGSGSNAVRVWDAMSGRPVTGPLKHRGQISEARFSSDGSRILTQSVDKTARLWDSHTGKRLTEVQHDSAVTSAEFSPDCTRIVTGSADRTARVWNAQNGKALTRPLKHGDWVRSAYFSPDGKRVLTSSMDQMARVWDCRSSELIFQPLRHNDRVYLAQFSPDARQIITASVDNTVWVWDALPAKALAEPLKHGAQIVSAQFSPDGKRIATASSDHSARIWDTQNAREITEPLQHDGYVNEVQFSPDGKRAVTASSDKTARVWDAETGNLLIQLNHDAPVQSARFSPDGKCLVTFSGHKFGRFWNAETGAPLVDAMNNDRFVGSAVFSPDGQRLLTSSGKQGRIWDAKTGTPLTEPIAAPCWSAEFSPDGRRILTTSIGWAQVWDSTTARPLTEPMKEDGIHLAHFSPDGKWIVSGSYEGTARIWDASSGKPATEALKHNGHITDARFSPDSKRIVTSSSDKTARIWDAATGKPLSDPIRHDDLVLSAQFSPDGKRILTAAGNSARVWDMLPANQTWPEWLPRLAEAVAGERINDRDVFEPPSEDRPTVLKELRKLLNSDGADDEWTIWGRWFLADRSTRTISPFSKITVPQYIENRIKENTPRSLDEAEQLAGRNAEALKRIIAARAGLPGHPN